MPDSNPAQAVDDLLALMRRLRDREAGCPWDLEQDFASIAPYAIEEAYEVYDAISRSDWTALREELGDLLFQVVFHARMAEERGWFDFRDVAAGLTAKMMARHPHIFGEDAPRDARTQAAAWEDHKARERAAKSAPGALDDLPLALPALLRAYKLQKRAARAGFDWNDLAPVLEKLDEEVAELKAEIAAGSAEDRLADELGDVLFTVVNLARHLKIDPEDALRKGNAKFTRRFLHVEPHLDQGRDAATLDRLWREAKRQQG